MINNGMGSFLGLTFPSMLDRMGATGGKHDAHSTSWEALSNKRSIWLLRRPVHASISHDILRRARDETANARRARLHL